MKRAPVSCGAAALRVAVMIGQTVEHVVKMNWRTIGSRALSNASRRTGWPAWSVRVTAGAPKTCVERSYAVRHASSRRSSEIALVDREYRDIVVHRVELIKA